MESLRIVHLSRKTGKHSFSYDSKEKIVSGRSTQKRIIELRLPRGRTESYFLKSLPSDFSRNEALDLKKRQRILKARGANVPTIFKPVVLNDNSSAVLTSDLSKDGHNVYSYNDRAKVIDPSRSSELSQLSNIAKAEIKQQLIKNCELAGAKGASGELLTGPAYELRNQAFMLVTDPKNIDFVQVVIGDLHTQDVPDRSGAPQEVTLSNSLQAAATFYTFITGDIFQVEDGNEYSSLNYKFKTAFEEGIRLRQLF